MYREDYMERILRDMSEAIENSIITVLNNRPRYLKRIPKKFYVKHFLQIHKQDKRPLERPNWNTWEIKTEIRIYDRLRKKFLDF